MTVLDRVRARRGRVARLEAQNAELRVELAATGVMLASAVQLARTMANHADRYRDDAARARRMLFTTTTN